MNTPDPKIGWAPCMTAYVIKALMDLGLEEHPRVVKSLEMMKNRQLFDGGWNCIGSYCVDECNCIISGTPWTAVCLSQAKKISKNDNVGARTIKLFSRYKKEIIKHGYKHDHCFRFDESLALTSLSNMGLTGQHQLINHFRKSLLKKQQPNGSWIFKGKSSGWYSIEALAALKHIDS